MGLTKIEWCDLTWNPWEGCTKVSEGCAHCYAETRNLRFHEGRNWGKGAPRLRRSVAYLSGPMSPFKWNDLSKRGLFRQCDVCGLREFRKWDATLPPGGLSCCSNPECVSLPESESFVVRPRVFMASLADWLDPEVPIAWFEGALNTMRLTPWLDWLPLTKRPELWRERLGAALRYAMMEAPIENDTEREIDRIGRLELANWIQDWLHLRSAPTNVWIGTSTENQKRFDERIGHLARIPAYTRYLSMEPLLGPIHFTGHTVDIPWCGGESRGGRDYSMATDFFNWTIIGGESGKDCRPMDVEWVRSIRDQCRTRNHMKCFVKQLGGHPDKRGALEDLPEDLRIREFPKP